MSAREGSLTISLDPPAVMARLSDGSRHVVSVMSIGDGSGPPRVYVDDEAVDLT